MLVCPWCGTNYATFQPNCKNCGGPLQRPAEQAPLDADAPPPRPLPSPRPISGGYAWRLLSADGGAIVALVFLVLGLVFAAVGAGLVIGPRLASSSTRGASRAGPVTTAVATAVTTVVGLPFAVLGCAFLIAGGALGARRYRATQQQMRVLREGQATEGRVVGLAENYRVRVNGRYPWVIRYQFRLDGRAVEGRVTTLNAPGAGLQEGRRVSVLYLPDAPERNTLYPHP